MPRSTGLASGARCDRGALRADIALLMAVLVMIAGFVGVVAIVLSGGNDGTTYEWTIPEGTSARQGKGVDVPNLPPAGLALRVNDSIRITNNDSVAHTYSFLVLRPGETGEYTFRNKGVFVGACTVGLHPQVTITVS